MRSITEGILSRPAMIHPTLFRMLTMASEPGGIALITTLTDTPREQGLVSWNRGLQDGAKMSIVLPHDTVQHAHHD